MEIQITADRTMGAVQDDFHGLFPNLKLMFFNKAHKAYAGSKAKFMLTDRAAPMRDICEKHADGLLYVDEDMPTWQFERLFEEEFGLHVQVFRKSGNIWLETSVTDDLTLEQQNAKGGAPGLHLEPEIVDYREQD